jgi:hypothetical protein
MANAILPSLATADDVVARLGRNLTPVETARVEALLDDGSAHIRRFCRRQFVYKADDVFVTPADGGIIVLPGRPIVDVSKVEAVFDAPGVPTINVYWYIFDGIDKITIPEPAASGIINLPEAWFDVAWYSNTYKVTYSHGDQVTPPEVMAVLCSAVISEITTPTMAGGVVSETVGSYSYSLRKTGSGIISALKDAGLDSLIDFRTKAGTIPIASQ